MPDEEIEIILTPEGTQIIKICNACLAEDGKDANCADSPLLAFVNKLREDGDIAEIRQPAVDPVEAPCSS